MKKRVIVRLTRGSERSPYHRTSQKMLQKKQSIIGSDMIHWYNMYACFPLFVNHAAKVLHFSDICKFFCNKHSKNPHKDTIIRLFIQFSFFENIINVQTDIYFIKTLPYRKMFISLVTLAKQTYFAEMSSKICICQKKVVTLQPQSKWMTNAQL